jgi:flotillin
MPPMMQVMKDIGGVEMPEFLARLAPDAGPRNGPAAETAAAPAPPAADDGRNAGPSRGVS